MTSGRCRGWATSRCSARSSSPTPTSVAETELVIIITPYFVEPTSGRLRTPLSGRVPPTDADRLVDAALQPSDAAAAAVGRSRAVCRTLCRLHARVGETTMKAIPLLVVAALALSACGDPVAEQAASDARERPNRADQMMAFDFRPGQRTARSVTGRPGAGPGGRAARPARRVRRRDRRHRAGRSSRAALRIWRAACRGPARVG